MWQGIIRQYQHFLPITSSTPIISLNEGNTPLILSEKLSKLTGLRVYLKYEGSNPTGSFKDRGMTVAVSRAVENGAKGIVCASTGNTSASAAAYGARAGLPCFVLLPQGAVALGKLSQAMIYNAKIIAVKGNFDDALRIVREVAGHNKIALVNSVNPDRIEGQKTAAFEICDQLEGESPDFHLIPVGNAGNITAYWKGYTEYYEAKKIPFLPVMLGFQASGAAPIVLGKPVSNPHTVATAIRIGNPASWKGALKAKEASHGGISAVTDAEILAAYRWLAANEGIFAEPASAASVAGLLKLSKKDYFKKALKRKKKAIAVCTLTGSGLKDPDTAMMRMPKPRVVKADAKSVLKELSL